MSEITSFTAEEVSELSYQTGWVMIDDHLAAMEALREAKDREIEGLMAENTAMYGAILEAADSGSIRCKLELQRIAAEDANKELSN